MSLEYEEFLARKALVVTSAGIDVDPATLHPALKPFQRDLVRWALRKGRSALFTATGCVSGDTILQGPDGDERIDELAERGKPIRVWALDANGTTVAAWADAPFQKGVAHLYRFSLASGRAIIVMARHRFLTPEGWMLASELHVGARIAASSLWSQQCADAPSVLDVPPQSLRGFQEIVDHEAHVVSGPRSYVPVSQQTVFVGASVCPPGFSPIPPVSTSGRFRSTFYGDGKRSPGTPQDCLGSYSPDYRLDDAQLRLALENDQESSPSPVGALGRSHEWLRADGPGTRSGCTHRHRWPVHLSRKDSNYQDNYRPGDEISPRVPSLSARLHELHQVVRRWLSVANLRSSVGVFPQLEQEWGGDRCEPTAYSFFDTVSSVDYVTSGPYYDLHVPRHKNYLANGIWNHNTGKTFMQCEWAAQVNRRAGVPVLILAPLSVVEQTVEEAARWGIGVTAARGQGTADPHGITISNYESLHKFDPIAFGAIVIDESSCLKDYTTATRTALIEAFGATPYRLACTATPAPNDIAEIANHAEFLGVMRRVEMLSAFFVHDEHGWRLKGHARQAFYRWLASWGMALTRPSDLGYSDDGYILPPLDIRAEIVESDYAPEGQMFALGLHGVGERAKVRKATVKARVARTLALIDAEPDEHWLIWCGLNAEQDAVAKTLGERCVSIEGSTKQAERTRLLALWKGGQRRVLVSKLAVFGWGMNFQHCARMTFVGLGDSYESYYQGIRRCHRYGNERSVHAHIVLSDLEQAIYANVLRKEQESERTMRELVANVAEFERAEVGKSGRDTAPYVPQKRMELPSWLEKVG